MNTCLKMYFIKFYHKFPLKNIFIFDVIIKELYKKSTSKNFEKKIIF